MTGHNQQRERADLLIDEWTWRAALDTFHAALVAADRGEPVPEETMRPIKDLVATACAAWRASGKPLGDFVATGVHPAQQLMLDRIEIIKQRAAAGAPLAPEIGQDV